ncbi:5-methyltetrahydropteroyltriglutamate--homocysteine S-methyltransferase [Lactobacillus sp. UCMA15818]|uniref:5-methyltetrahydropteroyltriglutamate-- homocysteine S-methyltransferase n=1 Tax=Lactobacillus sp. UCMA15818 TaxID=2583394 RepID=UPI0025B05447|nr:5-methyltetrahydropteroyltriglutamate--homocysteine S-methyltransferase [Lactobacillus sp. UCMA15818]MDN2454376.1 5-methyltetrahydropteroyltriglutamate--homocysteine S-methyltransferase [Lactobacillus sp. UCMA15818]
MVNSTVTKIHYDIVGSFLRPDELKKAREKFNNKEITAKELQVIEDNLIRELVEKEKESGLKIVTDGEFRRSYWHLDTFWGFEGIEHVIPSHGYLFHDEETRADSARVIGKIKFGTDHPDLRAYKFLKELVENDNGIIARQSIPAPAQFYSELVRDEENTKSLRQFYQTDDELIADIGKAYRELILALYDEGCRDIKLDDCTWGMVVDNHYWATRASEGLDRQAIQKTYLAVNNAALVNLPDDLRISTHVCRGNYHSTWAASGGYAPVADYLFAKEDVAAFYLEFDDNRSGDFAPLAKVPAGKDVVLGLVTSKHPALESPESLIARVNEAAQYVTLKHLQLSTQCGFASTEEGNKLTQEQQWAKIKLVVDTAKQIWK